MLATPRMHRRIAKILSQRDAGLTPAPNSTISRLRPRSAKPTGRAKLVDRRLAARSISRGLINLSAGSRRQNIGRLIVSGERRRTAEINRVGIRGHLKRGKSPRREQVRIGGLTEVADLGISAQHRRERGIRRDVMQRARQTPFERLAEWR